MKPLNKNEKLLKMTRKIWTIQIKFWGIKKNMIVKLKKLSGWV